MREVVTPLLLAAVLLVHTDGQTMNRQNCAGGAGHEAVIQPDADAFIAGFFAFHEAGENGVGCGNIRTSAMQSYEAIRWALDRLNKKDEVLNGEDLDDYYIPGIKIGMIAQDYCSSATTAISKAENLFPQFGSSENECQKNTDKLMLGLYVQMASGDAMKMHQMAQNRNLPLVSYTSTAPALSSTEMYPNFMRTIPPDGPLTKTIVEFIKQLGWQYVVVVHTDNSYGREAYRAIRPYLAEAGICLTAAFPADPDDKSDETIDGLLNNVMATNTTGVIYLGNNLLIDAFLRRGEVVDDAGNLQWIVTDSVSLSDTFPGQKYPRGLISVVPSGRKIIEFEDHWVRIDNNDPSPENPWYKDMYMKSFECRLPGVTNSEYTTDCPVKSETMRRNEFVQDQYVEPAVHGVYIYARALKQAHAVLCGGQPGMCQALQDLSTSDFYDNYMRDIDFMYGKAERIESLASFSLDPYNAAALVKFEGNDLINPSFEVYNFNDYPYGTSYKFQSVATYINELLEVITSRLRFYDEPRDAVLPFIPQSKCPSLPCSPCLGALIDSKYVYIPGDVIINALFSIHMPGPMALSCGEFDESAQQGIQAMQAFIYAVDYVNEQMRVSTGRLRGVTLGALGFDDCMDPILSNHLITEVQRYGRRIRDMNGENVLDPRTVEVFMARGLDPWMPVTMAELMNTMKRPVLGVETYTEVLDDTDMYPYFLRSQFGLQNIAMTIVNVAKRFGWKYLQSVYHTGPWGEESNKVLKRVAAEEGICIVASYEIPDVNGGAEVVDKLRGRPDVQPVALLLLSYGFRNFMEGMKIRNVTNELQLISLIGDNKKSAEGYEDFLDGMVSFELWWPANSQLGQLPTLEGFRQHLRNIDVKTYMTNPWMQEWFENFYDCKFNRTGSEVACGGQRLFDDFELNSDVISVIYSVFAAAQGLDETLKQYCGAGYNGVCGNFINARDKGMVLLQNILQKARYGEDGNIYEFYDRNGNIPSKYFNYNGFLKSFTYVGDYKPAEGVLYLENLNLNGGRSPSEIQSSCPGVCMECLYLFGNQKFMYIHGDIIIPAIFDVHYRGDSPYSCADLRMENGFQYTEAFRFALEQINTGQADVTLNGVRLGGLGFDGCTDHIRASAIVTGMYSGAFPTAGSNLAQTYVKTGDFAGWLSYDSESTISIATILERFNIPAVTPGATSPVLDDKSEFTNFFRTIPSDGRVAKAMAKLAHKLGFSYIITVNAPEEGSRDAVKHFRMYAEDQGICIGASYEFETDGDENQIMRYILQSTTKVVAVFASPDRYIEELIRVKFANPDANNVIFIANQPWDAPAKRAKPSGISPIPETINFRMDGNVRIDEFMYYLESESTELLEHPNPWFREYYQMVMQCNLAGTYTYNRACTDSAFNPLDINRIEQDIRVISTMNAVYAIAEGVHITLQQKCGVNYTGVCAAFLSDADTYAHIMNNMDALSFQDISQMVFRFIEREADRKISFSRFLTDGRIYSEGFYNANEEFEIPLEETLKRAYQDVPSTCIGECLQCQRDSSGMEKFMYIAGDLHIGALFDVHKMGGTPYTCGEINGINGFQLMEAFNWAMDYVNEKKGMFSRKLLGVKLGSLIFDTCSSPVKAGNLIANYHARNFKISTDEYNIDPSLIDLYIGPMTSEASIRVADVLAEIGIPQIGYGASSLELRDPRKYRYFIRTVPADDKQARALISILKKYKFPNIQLVSQFSSVGSYGRDEFVRLANLNKICISAEFVIGQSGKVTEDEARSVASRLGEKPDARVIIVIMDDPYALLREAEKFDYIIGNYSFIATDKWGFGISGYENLEGLDRLISSGNVMTLDVETADFPELDEYLEAKTPENYKTNPWFKEYYEYIHNCSVELSDTARYPSQCPEYLVGYPRAVRYIQDPYALYVINAVFSTALGIHETLYEWCGGDQYYGVCNILRTHGERREYFLENIKKATFVDKTDQPFNYTKNGESDRGFHVYEPQSNGMSLYYGSNGYYWEDIGSYNDTHYLKMDVRYKPDWISTCDPPGACLCEFPKYQPSRYLKKPSPLDLNIVFISDIHQSDPDNNLGCGAIDTASNMQNLFAFLYALESVNNNTESKFPGSLKLGGVALDTCSQSSRIGQDAYSLLSGEPVCGDKSETQVVPPASIVAYMVRNSANSIAASSMLSPLKITSLSMSATSVELNDKLEHAYFLRTVPPDNVQALVVARILKAFDWDYITVVYSENSYGRSAVQTLLSQSDRNNPQFCFGRAVSMPLDADLNDAKHVIDQLNQLIGARVVVTFVTSEHVPLLLQATEEKGLKHRFTWIGSDTWANNYLLTRGYEDTAAGAVTIQIRSEYSNGFRDFVKNITFNDRKGIPDDWFEELYQTVHQCRILSSQIQKTYTKICSGEEVFTDEMVPHDPFVLHTILSVYQIATGLSDVEACKQSGLTIASCLSLQPNRRQLIYNSVLNAQHDVLPNDLGKRSFNFKFTSDGYGDIGYNIYNFRRNVTSGQYEYIQIGSSAGELVLNIKEYKSYSFTSRSQPSSNCPPGSTCQCQDSSGEPYTFSRSENGYIVTADGQYMDPTTGQLVTIEDTPGINDRFRDIWAIIVCTLAAIGAFAALCMFVYLLVVYPVRGGTTVLGYMLIFGVILMYCLVFTFIVHASEEVCGLRRFCLGFVYSIAYSALFVKLVDCWRTKDKEDIYMVKYNKIGNPWGLFFSACLIVLVQVMINAEWLILEKPEMMRVIYNNKLWPRCVPDDFYDEGLILSNVFIMFLIFVSVLVGLAAFGNDKNHWDCRWIVGCVVLTIPAWMVWCLVAALGEYKMRDAAAAIGLLYNATVMLMCGPLRKLYLLNKYQASLEEEERKSQMALSSQKDYNSMYGRQYDNMPHMQDGDSIRGSTMGNDDVFLYDPKSS
ncbi:uncharacterized protein LOC123533311 isoform X2 [Mercenaria mercenaria]|uniref:uncharacterized protein LOC123533311 isoform X2 n=1 Tax=Mercenaria mercenaria TaxID=6596 RepID=UPI00234E738A|nr:uncharacterized protein LOC123533311 isoform X2 [Mercenaria mercenaria]